jgi:hypothetical protein
MAHIDFSRSRAPRREIIRAADAIERQVRQLTGKPDWRTLWVIGTNLTIIRANVAGARDSSN